jgi:hypothetical protein
MGRGLGSLYNRRGGQLGDWGSFDFGLRNFALNDRPFTGRNFFD